MDSWNGYGLGVSVDPSPRQRRGAEGYTDHQ